MFWFPVFSCFHQFQHNLSRGTHDKYVLVNFTLPLQNSFKCSLSNQIHAPSLQYKHREVWNMFKANNWSIITSKKSFWCFIVNFERISYLLLVFVLLFLNSNVPRVTPMLSLYIIPPENPRKPLVFWCFQGVWNENIGQKWISGDVEWKSKLPTSLPVLT